MTISISLGDFHNTVIKEYYKTKAQNFEDGEFPDGRSGILRITQDGQPVWENGILGNEYPLNLYYAYGIRNSFGLAFDPVTGILWDTENGPDNDDEINLAEPGFNSGSAKIWGKWLFDAEGDKLKNPKNSKERFVTVTGVHDYLVYFNGKGHYSEPEFIWDKTMTSTGLIFLDSQSLGEEYENDLFVDSADGSRLFHFDLSDDRRDLVLDGDISGNAAKNSEN